jgi:hypothetical protein
MAFALGAARVARTRGLPLVLYLMDLLAEGRANPVERIWARATERKLVKQASAVFCLTEGIRKHYSHKYNISPVLIPHCVTEPEIAEAAACRSSLAVGSPVSITYAGGVYQARLDSLLVVKQAIENLNAQGYPAQLRILGRNDPARLASWGIAGPYVSVRFIADRSEFTRQLRQSDVLLSTIAFRSAYPLQDRTCFPTKTLDYFLAGKPVLVVAPDSSDYVGYMKEKGSAMTVTALDSSVVAKCILQLATDMSIRRQLVASGLKTLYDHNQGSLLESLNRVLLQSVKSPCT